LNYFSEAEGKIENHNKVPWLVLSMLKILQLKAVAHLLCKEGTRYLLTVFVMRALITLTGKVRSDAQHFRAINLSVLAPLRSG
jgi:hypothetical protein